MNNRDLNRQLNQLKDLIDRTGIATDDIELQGHWGRYLCVVVAAFVENGLQTIYSEFASQSSSWQVARYVQNRLGRVTNPNSRLFLEVAGSFNDDWREELEVHLLEVDSSRKDALDSIMNNRNQIAHGRSTGITVHRVRAYFERCVEILEFIESQCEGN